MDLFKNLLLTFIFILRARQCFPIMQGYTKITVKWVLFQYVLWNSFFVSILFWADTYFKSNSPTLTHTFI